MPQLINLAMTFSLVPLNPWEWSWRDVSCKESLCLPWVLYFYLKSCGWLLSETRLEWSLGLTYASAFFSGWLRTCGSVGIKPFIKRLCRCTSSKALKVIRSCFTWIAKGESWMLERFSWRCGPSRPRELEAEARPIQRGNKVQIFLQWKELTTEIIC